MHDDDTIAVIGRESYLSGLAFDEFTELLEERHPFLARMVQPAGHAVIAERVAQMNRASWEFEDDGAGGRGTAYNIAQRATGNRSEGMERLLRLCSAGRRDLPGPEIVLLDALAGDGTLTRFAATLPVRPTIISADLSAMMIERCLAQGLPAIRQPATESFLRSSTLDAVLIAYGSHHLDAEGRRRAAAEARRTLRPGGRFVLHDFETGGAVDAWFREVVHPFSLTGHPHPHFSREEMQTLLAAAGFSAIEVFEMDDPFLICGASPGEAREGMLCHLHNMYGLARLPIGTPGDLRELERRVVETMGEMTVRPGAAGWIARLPRTALVAVGTA